MSFQTVLFDLDGTLIDSRADLTSAVNFGLKRVGRPPQTVEEVIPRVGNGLHMLMSECLGPVSEEVLNRSIAGFSEYYDEHLVDQTVLYEGVREVLEALRRSARLGVISNKPHRFSVKILEALGVASLFSSILGGDSLSERKPHPAPLLKAIEELGGQIPATLMVGDTVQDIRAGQAAGTCTCAARYGYGFGPEVSLLKPDFLVDRFNEIKEIVL